MAVCPHMYTSDLRYPACSHISGFRYICLHIAAFSSRYLRETNSDEVAMAEAPECVICRSPLNDGTEVTSLPCAHSMHSQCLQNYASIKGQPVSALPCSVCKLVPAAAMQMAPEAPAAATSARVEVVDVIEDAMEDVPELVQPDRVPVIADPDDEEPLDTLVPAAAEKGKAKGTPRGPPRGRPKPKAKPKAKKGKGKGKGKGKTAPAEAAPVAAEPVAVEAAEPDPEAPPAMVPCVWCKVEVEAVEANCSSSRRGEYRCKACSSSRAALYRAGAFPNLQHMSNDEVQQFFTKCSELNIDGKLELSRTFQKQHFEKEVETFAEGGSYLPLSVWQSKGFDTSRIEALSEPANIDEHPILGTTYRVVIKSKAMKRDHGTMQTDNVNAEPASSSSNLAGLSLRELIEKQKEESKKRAKLEKEQQVKAKKAMKPGENSVKMCQDLISELKAEKLPAAMRGDANPLHSVVAELKDILQSMATDSTPAKIEKLNQQVAIAKDVCKSMRPFV